MRTADVGIVESKVAEARDGRLFLRLVTRSGTVVPALEGAGLEVWLAAGYAMKDARYTAEPVWAKLVEDGKYWRLLEVRPGSRADEAVVAEESVRLVWARAAEALRAGRLVALKTTGVTAADEAFEAAVCIYATLGDSLPQAVTLSYQWRPTFVTPYVTPEAARCEEQFPYEALRELLDGQVWLAWNVPFQMRLLTQTCQKYGKLPILPSSTLDLQTLYGLATQSELPKLGGLIGRDTAKMSAAETVRAVRELFDDPATVLARSA